MPKTKNLPAKPTKKKLSPAERSQIAKDRWEKRRNAVVAQDAPSTPPPVLHAVLPDSVTYDDTVHVFRKNPDGTLTKVEGGVDFGPKPVIIPFVNLDTAPTVESLLDHAVANAPEGSDRVDIVSEQGTVLASQEIKDEQDDNTPAPLPVTVPAPQLTSAPPKKQKRTPVPKEFLVALKTADHRLAKAIEEYEDCQQRLTYLSGAIPRLQRTVLALRNESNPDAIASSAPPSFNYDAIATFQAPFPQQFQQPMNPLQAIQNAQPAPPISRASGGTMQFGPDVVGSLEGPDDDDNPDKFITGPHASSKGWI